ncbi:MAG: hypothetical protein ACOX6P_05960 [Candidatus Merdivicinus sp.]|jgi:hypothetical protein
MKNFCTLFSREFTNCTVPTWILALIAILFQPLFYWITLQNTSDATRFETVYLASAAPIVVPVLFAALTGWMIWMTMRDITNGSVATLLTLPGRRSQIYLAKILAFCTSLLILIARILTGIALCYPLFLSWCEKFARIAQVDCRMTAGFWLGLCRTPLFRLLCPMTFREMISTLLLLLTLPLLSFHIGWRRGRRWVRSIILALPVLVSWIFILRSRLNNYTYLDRADYILYAVLLGFLALMILDSFRAVRNGDF